MESSKEKVPVTFGAGCAINEEMIYVASFIDELPDETNYTRMFVLNMSMAEQWFYHDIPDETIVSVAFKPEQNNTARICYSLSDTGMVEGFNSEGEQKEQVANKDLLYDKGVLFALSSIAGELYACGAGGQVYKKTNESWSCISTDLVSSSETVMESFVDDVHNSGPEHNEEDIDRFIKQIKNFVVLYDIAGGREDDIYVCGNDGLIFHWNGSVWNKIKSGTKQHLHAIHYVDDSNIFICGNHGTILRGNYKEGFRRIPIGRVDENFWSIRYFNKKIYIGTCAGLFCLDLGSNKVNNISAEIDRIPSGHAVASIDSVQDVLWVIADKFVLRLKDDWQVITHPDNV